MAVYVIAQGRIEDREATDAYVEAATPTLAAHGACQKSMVYSKNRILKPMKRVDFDPNGDRNIQNRGKSELDLSTRLPGFSG